MQEFLLTLVVIFVLFRIFGSSSASRGNVYTFTQNNFNQKQERKQQEGKVTIENNNSKSSKNKDLGEYVDYEEIK